MKTITRIVLFAIVALNAGCAPLTVRLMPRDVILEISAAQLEPGHALRCTVQAPPETTVFLEGFGQRLAVPAVIDSVGDAHAGKTAGQGMALSRTVTPSADLQQRNWPADRYEAFLAIPMEATADVYTVTLTAHAADGRTIVKHARVGVLPRTPDVIVRLWIRNFEKYDFDTESAMMAASREKARPIAPAGRIIALMWPVTGRISELFGVRRIYNNGVKEWYHGGIDIAAPGGTPIYAPAPGEVVLCRNFSAHGKTTLIHHGCGVITTYLHQQAILVNEGQWVKTGDLIGKVGSTGSSTGNHLHFQINVNTVKVDPFDFLEPQPQM
ncbi:M23 family metallopeptidase [candidate division FCPU426 bacterium]|nr:M23 family metallopeptidase [candidate division FCPU426 bacterium]